MLDKLSQTINQGVEYLLFVFGLSMAVIVAVQVFFRYILNHSLFWSEELARYLLIWITFLGASSAYRRKGHPGIDMLYNRVSESVRRSLSIVVHLVSMMLFVIMIRYGIEFSYFVRMQISPALYIPKWVIYAIIPVSGMILIIHALCFLFQTITGTRHDG